MHRFKARFDGDLRVERSSAEHSFTHAWLLEAEAAGEKVLLHGFTISKLHAERRLAEHRRLYSRPFSRIKILREEIAETRSEAAAADGWRHASPAI